MKWFIQIIVGYLLADFIGGIFHWFEDSYLSYCTKIPLLSSIAKDNEMHHYYPRLIVNYSWYESIYITLLITTSFFVLFYFTLSRRFWKNYWIFIYTSLIVGTFTNILHKFAHMRDCETNQIIKVLQFFGLIQSHDYHSLHHEQATNRYCIVSVYLNPILDFINFWKGIEYVIFILTGIQPKKKDKYIDYKSIHTNVHIESRKECPRLITDKEEKELQNKLKKYKNCQI